MVKNRKVTVPAGMMRRRVVFSPKKVRKAKQFEWIPTMAMPDEEHHMFPKDEEEEEEQEEEAETFERAGVFPFKELPSEIRDMIYNYALNKRGKKKPDLLDALRGQSVLREAALNIYYQTNSFTVGLLKHSPLGPDIESNEAVAFMKDIKVHVPYAYSPSPLFPNPVQLRSRTAIYPPLPSSPPSSSAPTTSAT